MAPSDETPQEPSQTPDSPSEPTPASEPLSMKAERRRFPALDGPFWKNWKTPAALAAVVALALGFGGGYVTANGLSGKPLFGGDSGGSSAQTQEIKGAPWWQFGKPRSANAPRAGIPRPDGFAVWKTRLDTSRSEPLACIEMTKPLDSSKAYADFVLISPDTGGTPAVSINQKNKAELCIGGLGLTERRVTLLKGLPGAGGQTLAANADVDFTFGEKPPYVGFAGDGVILPRKDSDGIGIETVNVSRLAIEVWRVSDRNLVRKSVSAPDPTGEGQWPSDYGDDSPDDEGRVVWKGEVAVRGQQGERATTVFPLGAVLKDMKPGGYVIKARDASTAGKVSNDDDDDDEYGEGTQPAQARRWVIFTDMAMVAYDGSESLDVVVRSLKSAKVQAGVRVALVAKNGEDLAEATSDGSGRVRFLRPLLEGDGAMKPKMVMAYGPQGDLAVLDLDRSPVDLSKQGMGGRTTPGAEDGDETGGRTVNSDIDGFLYADRGIYRPGEMVHLAALIRDVQSKAVKDRKGVIVVSRPSGVEFRRIAFDRAPGGVVTADLGLPKSAPRGRWKATLQIEGIKEPTGQLSFSVEDFAPQRLAVDTDGRAATPVAAGETRQISVLARFLYGASGAGLQTQGEARIMADTNPFPAYKDYQWGDQQTAFDEKFMELGTSVTDGDGKAVLSVSTADLPETTTPLKATVTASVFEPGGRPVRESLFLKVRTKPVYLGVKIEQGDGGSSDATPVTLDVIAVDSLGKRIAAPGSTYTLIAENWDYDWFQQDGRWQWRRTSRDVVVQKGALNIGAGGAARVARRLGWGDYRLVVEGPSGAKSVIRFAAGWGAPAKDAEAPDFVRISAGTGTHGQGDSVTLTIKAPYAGEAQVAVATDRVIDFKTFSVGENGGSVSLKTNAAWGGGAYVLVSVIQPRDPKATPKPRRALGLLYVPLDPKGRKLTVELGTPTKLNSRAPVEVPVAVKGLGIGQRARITVAAVDEGILRLTKFDSPDPVKWYFGKRALTLDYRDDYGRLLDANLGAPANVNFGSDQLGGEGLTVTPIKSVALWSGVVETGLDGKAKIKLPAAEFNGELRVMAVAWTDEAVGSASKAMTVREAVIADLNLPRFLAPGDKPFATLELHNVEGAAGGYTAETSSSGGVQMVFRKVFQLVLGQRIAERIPFLAPTVSGVGKVGFKVSGPNGFSTAKDYPIQTRLGWSPVTRTYTELQAAGAAYTPTPNMLAGLAAGDVSMTVSYSPFKGFDPGPIAASLSRYPYGCTEQVVSVAYPLLYAREMAPDPKKRSSSAGLNDAVGKLLDRQTLDGAFGLWRVGDGEADAWLGAYATDFLWEAKMRGAPVPDAAMERALNAMRQISRPDGWANVSYRLEYPEWWGRNADDSKKATERMRSRASAYALYILAKSGRGDLARLRWWHDVHMKDDDSPMARAQIGAGLALMGDKSRARSSFRKAVAAIGYRDDNDWYQSQLRDIAGVIALAYEADMPDIARDLQKRLDGAVRDPDSLNTQEQARLLQAASFMLKAAGVQRIDATGVFALPTAGQTRWSVGRLADAKFVNRGTGALWRTVTVRGTTIAAPGGESNGLSVGKRFFTMSGVGVDPMSLRQGDRVIVLVSGRSMQGRTVPLVIDDALPAGWEIETTLSPEDAKEGPFKFLGELTGVDVQEARDDRYISAVDLGGNRSFAVAYVARAVTPGEFFLPATEVRDMYRPSVNARGDGARTTIAAGN